MRVNYLGEGFVSVFRHVAKFALIFFLVFNLNPIGFCDEILEEAPVDIQIMSLNSGALKTVMPKLNASSAIVMDAVTGRVLYEKNAHVRRPMASTTKIMTAILALEKGNLNDIVTVGENAVKIWGSRIRLRKGEKIRLEDLLYGLMLSSGNDAAIAIAEHIGGSLENFVGMMNTKAREIGAFNTSFVNPHGLDKNGHYSTAYDLALISRYALKNKKFCELVSTYKKTISGQGKHSFRSLHNTNEVLLKYPGADGIKTGFTAKAGRCLVGSATRNNWRVITVVLNSSSRYWRATDTINLLNYAFDNYELMDLNKIINLNSCIYVKKGKEKTLNIFSEDKIPFPLRKDEIEQLNLKYELPNYLSAPVKKGTRIGTAVYCIGEEKIKTIDLLASKDIERKNVFDYLKEVVEVWSYTLRFCLKDILL